MKVAKLYLICPDCYLEPVISAAFGQDAYFLTALGSVFDFSEFNFAESLHKLISREAIGKIILVNDTRCTFIENTICKAHNYNTKAEQELARLQQNNAEKFAPLRTTQQRELLARLNCYRQAYELLDVAFVGGRISDGHISVGGLLYDRHSSLFEQVTLEL